MALSAPYVILSPKTVRLLTLGRNKVRGKFTERKMLIWPGWYRQHLDKVENTNRNAVLDESVFSVRVSFSPKLSMNLRTICTSQVHNI